MERQVCKRKPGVNYAPAEGADRLESMMAFQRQFAERFIDFKGLTETDQEEWTKRMADCLIMEAAELKEETNWKHWKKTKKEFSVEQARFEVMDILAFAFNAAMVLGMNPDDFYQYFMTKVEINHDRQKANY